MTYTSPLCNTRTSAFTLPSPQRKSKQHKLTLKKQHQSQQQSQQQSPTTPLHSTESYQELPSSHQRSPSFPWLVEYLGASFFKSPSFLMEQMCSCTSAQTVMVDSPSPDIAINQSNSSSYFDDTILRSDPTVNRSPTKISSSRWEALRAVVASHGDYTIKDYCANYDTVGSCNNDKHHPLGVLNEVATENVNAKYPTKSHRNEFRRASILADESKDDAEMYMNTSFDAEDDIRAEPPASPSATAQSESCLDLNKSASHSGRGLNTCHSFDQYIDTSRYFCSSKPFSTPQAQPQPAPPQSPPATSLPDRRRSRQLQLQSQFFEMQMQSQSFPISLAPRTLGFQQLALSTPVRTPPSPALSAADTYTTISLSHSFAREFESDSSSTPSPTRSPWRSGVSNFQLNRVCDSDDESSQSQTDFLDRLASETTRSPPRSPFRRLRSRSSEEETKEESDLENKLPSTPPRRRKRASDEDEKQDDDDSTAYRCLVRMSPDNYKHGKSSSSIYEDWCNMGEEPTRSLSNASSSVLLPLHPHQRIMLPLPQFLPNELESEEQKSHGSSEYTCFRHQAQRQKVSSTADF